MAKFSLIAVLETLGGDDDERREDALKQLEKLPLGYFEDHPPRKRDVELFLPQLAELFFWPVGCLAVVLASIPLRTASARPAPLPTTASADTGCPACAAHAVRVGQPGAGPAAASGGGVLTTPRGLGATDGPVGRRTEQPRRQRSTQPGASRAAHP